MAGEIKTIKYCASGARDDGWMPKGPQIAPTWMSLPSEFAQCLCDRQPCGTNRRKQAAECADN